MTRNIWCRRYPQCLDAACADDKPFDCSGCTHRDDEGGHPPDWKEDASRCMDLILVVFEMSGAAACQ